MKKLISVSLIMWLSSMLISCTVKATDVTIPPLPTNNFFFKKQKLLKNKISSAKVPKIKIPKDYFLEAEVKTDLTKKSNFRRAVRIDIKAKDHQDSSYKFKEMGKTNTFVMDRNGSSMENLILRMFFIGDKFYGGKIQKVNITIEESECKKNKYYHNYDNMICLLNNLEFNIIYNKNGETHHTYNNDEILLIRDSGGPSRYALLVCDGKCYKTRKPEKLPSLETCKIQDFDGQFHDCKSKIEDNILRSYKNFLDAFFPSNSGKKAKHLTLTLNVPDTISNDKDSEEQIEGSKSTSSESKGNTSDTGKIRINQKHVKFLKLKDVQIKPYTKLYGEDFMNPACNYTLTKPVTANLKKDRDEGKYYFNNKRKITNGDKLTINVKPKRRMGDKCISKTLDTAVSIDAAEGTATAKFEVPHAQPWLLVYATSAGFPAHSKDDVMEKVDRRIFLKRMFDNINRAYTTNLNQTQSIYWLTVDAYQLLAAQEPEWLAGGYRHKERAKKLVLSSDILNKLSMLNGSSPDFDSYKKAILAYSKKHSTHQNYFNDVVIIQGINTFSPSLCSDFEKFASYLEREKIKVMYINPVEKIQEGAIENGENRNNILLKPLRERAAQKPIYTCNITTSRLASKLITFEYFEHKDADKWDRVQELLFNQLDNIKNNP